MPSDKKLDLEGFSIDQDNVCHTDGWFEGRIRSVTDNVLTIGAGDIVVIGSNGAINLATTTVFAEFLPTSDPGVSGQLWNDSGTLKISAG